MNEIEYPYEIESSDGCRWVFTDNEHGKLFIGGECVEYAQPDCETLINAIENEHFAWPKGSCLYHGPLRYTTLEVNDNDNE